MAATNGLPLEEAHMFIGNHKQTSVLLDELMYAIGKHKARTFYTKRERS